MIARIAKIAGIARIENRGSVWTLLAVPGGSAGAGGSTRMESASIRLRRGGDADDHSTVALSVSDLALL